MDHQDANVKLQDELLPELEISLIPSKLSDNCKVDLFGLSEEFMNYLAIQGILTGNHNDDVHIMSLEKTIQFVKTIRDAYKKYKVHQEN